MVWRTSDSICLRGTLRVKHVLLRQTLLGLRVNWLNLWQNEGHTASPSFIDSRLKEILRYSRYEAVPSIMCMKGPLSQEADRMNASTAFVR